MDDYLRSDAPRHRGARPGVGPQQAERRHPARAAALPGLPARPVRRRRRGGVVARGRRRRPRLAVLRPGRGRRLPRHVLRPAATAGARGGDRGRRRGVRRRRVRAGGRARARGRSRPSCSSRWAPRRCSTAARCSSPRPRCRASWSPAWRPRPGRPSPAGPTRSSGAAVALVAATVVPQAPLRRPRVAAAEAVRKISELLRGAEASADDLDVDAGGRGARLGPRHRVAAARAQRARPTRGCRSSPARRSSAGTRRTCARWSSSSSRSTGRCAAPGCSCGG